MSYQADYIIIGQGMAGTVLGHTLLHAGNTVVLVDDPSLSNSSRIAAGLYNPVVFKRLNKSWLADELLPAMDEFYPRLEAFAGDKFYFKRNIVKIFAEENEKQFWTKKVKEGMSVYLDEKFCENWLPGLVNADLGVAFMKEGGNLDVAKFLNFSTAFFREKGILLDRKFDKKDLSFEGDRVRYGDVLAKKIIFCQGRIAATEPFFSWLPFNLTKGEILTIRIPGDKQIPFDKVINKWAFVLPLGEGLYRVGATYKWDVLDEQSTEEGRSELLSRLDKILEVPYEVVAHSAGVRPTVDDRRPLIGLHPLDERLAIFNGMGSKAVMLSPYFAKQFSDFLAGKAELHPEADIRRFGKKYQADYGELESLRAGL